VDHPTGRLTTHRRPAIRSAAGGYAFDVQGHLDNHWAEWLGDLRITHNPDGTSTLVGLVVDQAELHGVLTKLRDLGVALIAVAPQPQGIPETELCTGTELRREEDRP
jgi:hypothetical protein